MSAKGRDDRPALSSDWRRLDELLDRFLELSPERASEELERLKPEDRPLRERLEAALALAQSDAGPLANSVADSWPGLLAGTGGEDDFAAPVMTGASIGRWRITGELGQGGMGTVYAVDRADGVYEQQAALKLVRLGIDEPAARERFARERQILARLEHPSIARLLDGGVAPDGRPYLVLERVEGEPITLWCERQGIGVRERLGLFVKVLEAVGYAHRNLVVHLDLKPSNVLVAAAGEVRLLDFGIAKLLAEKPEVERTATRVSAPLTPQYAAPEQITADAVTTATDVYALGVLLYELICGERPYRIERGSAAELERQILETDPAPPSSRVRAPHLDLRLARALRGDLDAIVLRALAKRPDDRYASATELRLDIENWLLGRAVEARRASGTERLAKFVRRHRVGVAAAVLVALFAIVGVASLGYALLQARERLAAAERARASLDFLVGLFEAATPAQSRDRSISAIDLLDRGVEQLDRELADQPSVHAELARTLGDVYRTLALFERARPLLDRGRREAQLLFGDDSVEHAAALYALAELEYDVDRYPEAEELMRRALAIQQQALGTRDPTTLRSLGSLGDVLSAVGRYDEALEIHTNLLAIDSEQFGEAHEETVEDRASIAGILRRLGRFEESEGLYRQVVAARSRALGDDHPRTLSNRMSHANVLRHLSRYDEAERILLEVLAACERVFGPGHPETASALDSLGSLYRDQGRFAESLALAGRALEIEIATLGPDASETAVGRNNLAILAVGAGDFAIAEEGFREALRVWTVALGAGHPHRASALANLGYVLVERGRAQEAKPLVLESLEKRAAHFGEESSEAAQSWRILALVHLALGDLGEARRTAEQADRLVALVPAENNPRRADTLLTRAQVELANGDASAAEPLIRQALAIRIARHGPTAPKTAEARLLLVRVLIARGEFDAGREELALAGAALTASFEPSNWRHGEIDLAAAELELAVGDHASSTSHLAAARARFELGKLDADGPILRRVAVLAGRLER